MFSKTKSSLKTKKSVVFKNSFLFLEFDYKILTLILVKDTNNCKRMKRIRENRLNFKKKIKNKIVTEQGLNDQTML